MGLEEISDQPFLKPFYLSIKTNVATRIVIWCRLQLFYSPEIWDKRSEFQNTFKNNILTKNLFFTDQRYITVLAWRNSISGSWIFFLVLSLLTWPVACFFLAHFEGQFWAEYFVFSPFHTLPQALLILNPSEVLFLLFFDNRDLLGTNNYQDKQANGEFFSQRF